MLEKNDPLPIYSSPRPKSIYGKDRIILQCDNCKIYFERIQSNAQYDYLKYGDCFCPKCSKERAREYKNKTGKSFSSQFNVEENRINHIYGQKIRKVKEWSEEEISLLREKYSISTIDELKILFPKRSLKSINRRAERLNLNKTEETKFKAQSVATTRKWIKGNFDREETSKRAFKNFAEYWESMPKGNKSPTWKEKRKDPERRNRDCFEYKEWRKRVFARDRYTCQKCYKTGGYIQAHHIKPFKTYPSLRYELTNGITLCKSCHQKINKREKLYINYFMKIIDEKSKLDANQKIAPIEFLEAKHHKKGWGGGETWIVNNELYCFKILEFSAGKRCSMHFHNLKTETWYLASGEILMRYYNSETGDMLSKDLFAGDVIHIPRGQPHQIIAKTDVVVYEVSTTHFEEDSYRILPGSSQEEQKKIDSQKEK